MATTDVKIGEWVDKGFKLYKENIGLLILASLVGGVLSAVTAGILMGPMMAGMALIVFGLYKKATPKPEVKTLFDGFAHFLQTFLLWLVVFVALLILMVLNLIPILGNILYIIINLVITPVVILAVFLIVDKGMDFWPALLDVFGKMKTDLWPFIGFFLLVALIANIGAILCGIGVVITFPICFCILAVAYHDIYQ